MTAADSSVDRRTFIRTVGFGVGTTAAGGAAMQSEQFAPVGESEALGLVTAGLAAAGGITIATAAGVAIYEWGVNGNTDVDTSDVLQDQIYNAALSVAEGRSVFESEMQTEYVDAPTGESPYADAAWSEIRANAAEVIVNGGAKADAQAAAQEALKAQTRRAIHNIVQRWNTAINALSAGIKTEIDEGTVGVLDFEGIGDQIGPGDMFSTGSTVSGWEPVLESSGYVGIWKQSMDSALPGTKDAVDGESTELQAVITTGNSGDLHAPHVMGLSRGSDLDTQNQDTPYIATHPDFENKTILNPGLYSDVFGTIETEYNNISSDLSTYVDTLYNALNQGAIDPADIYSPSDIVESFANTDKRTRTAAELMAVGAQVPDSVSYEAKISHPDLSVDSLWCDLYLSFTGDPVAIEANMTLATDQYDMAYIGYDSEVNDQYVTDTLSGDSALDILDTRGVEGSADLNPDNVSEQSSGAINFGSDVPDQVVNPGEYEDTFVFKIETAENGVFTAPVADAVQNDDGTWSLPDTASPLSGSETIEKVTVTPKVTHTKSVEFVADPTTANSQELQDLYASQSALIDKVESLEEAAEGGGGGFDFGGSWFGFPSWLYFVVAAIVAFVAFNDDNTTIVSRENRRPRNSNRNRKN